MSWLTRFIPSFKRNTWEEKANPAYFALASYGESPQPHMMPRQYKNYATEGYRGEPATYKCISYIARNGAAIPLKLYTNRSKEEEIPSHPLLDRLNRPNPEQSGVAYREAVLSYLLIAGNAYQYAIRSGQNRPPDELWVLRPDYIQVVANKQGITGYEYKGGGMDGVIYEPSEVSHVKYWCPNDDLYGLSPMEIAAILIDQQTSARKWNLALLQNWARLPGAWVVPNVIGKNERDRLEAKLKEKFSGARNAGSPPVLDGGLKWEAMGVAPAQMDWLQGLQLNAAQIANIYNISPVLIGDTSATTYDNMKQAEIYSYTEAIFPDLDKVYDMWNSWLVPMYPDLCDRAGRPVAYLYYDKEAVEVIQEMLQKQKNAQSQRATTMFLSSQCTLNETRELQGLPSLPGGDRLKIGNALIPVSMLVENDIIAITNIGVANEQVGPDNTPQAVQPHNDADLLPSLGQEQQSSTTKFRESDLEYVNGLTAQLPVSQETTARRRGDEYRDFQRYYGGRY
jgi:HK97 family phage portal protein